MTRISLIALALFAYVTPAVSSHSPGQMMDKAQGELRLMDQELNQMRHAGLRAQLQERVNRVDRLLVRIENTGALEQRFDQGYGQGRGYSGRDDQGAQRPGAHAPRGITFSDAMRMVRSPGMDQDKLAAVRSIAARGRFTSEQAMRIADQLSFDSNKAEALIILHSSVTDPYRFRVALEILDFSSNRRRVARTVGA